MKHLVQAVFYLSSPNFNPSYPCSESEIQEEIDLFFAIKEEILQLLLSGFVLQALLGVQMSEALDKVEEVVIE